MGVELIPVLQVNRLQCHVEVELFMCCNIFPLQLCITPNALVFGWYRSVGTLVDMLMDLLTVSPHPAFGQVQLA